MENMVKFVALYIYKMYKKLKALLSEAGLNEAEIDIYVELLKKPSQTKWELINRTGFNKNQVYRAFDRLIAFKMIEETNSGIEPLSLDFLLANLESSRIRTYNLVTKLKNFSPFLKIPIEAVNDFQLLDTKEKILDKYMMMSQIKYNTCLDFGDLESFVPVVDGLDSVFKFRTNRFNQSAENKAICTTTGPFTSCMMRKQDLNDFKSNIKLLDLNFKNKWIIFSDNNDYVMFNDCSNQESPSSVLVKSKVVADIQRFQFDQFHKKMEKF